MTMHFSPSWASSISSNDLVDPITYTILATRVSLLLKHLPPALFPSGDHLAKLFDLRSNIIRYLERMKPKLRLGEDISHGAATAPKWPRQPDYQVGSTAPDASGAMHTCGRAVSPRLSPLQFPLLRDHGPYFSLPSATEHASQ